MSKKKTDKHIYPVITSTSKNGVKYIYSSINNKGFFGDKKIIFGDGGIGIPIIDILGDYGLSEHAIGLEINSIEQGEIMKKCLMSNKFQKILKACNYSSFQLEWNIFPSFKKNFYELLDDT